MVNQDILKHIDDLVQNNSVILFIKGSVDMPMCGFSARVIKILQSLEIDFIAIDVLQDERIRQGIKEYADWPTIPQLYINSEFIGGCDIVTEMYQNGELQSMLNIKTNDNLGS